MEIYLITTPKGKNNYINDKNNDRLEYKLKHQDLDYKGRLQAQSYYNYFHNLKINKIYTSTYQTSLETSKIIFPHRKIIPDPNLDNLRLGITKLSELPSYFLEQHFLDSNYKLPGGETRQDLTTRMLNLYHHILKDNSPSVAIITHKLNIIYFLKKFCLITYAGEVSINNTCIKSSDTPYSLFKLIIINNTITNIEHLII